MRIEILRTFETRDPHQTWTAGEAVTVKKEQGRLFVSKGLAREVTPEIPVIPDGVEDAEISESGD